MLRISQLKLPVEHTPDQIRSKLIKTLKIREEELLGYQVRRQSLDARKKPELFLRVYGGFSGEKWESAAAEDEKQGSEDRRKTLRYP